MSVTCDQCNARLRLPSRHHRPLAVTNYTASWQRHTCKWLAQGCTRQCSRRYL